MHTRLVPIVALLAGCIQAPATNNSIPSGSDLGPDVGSPADVGENPGDSAMLADLAVPDMSTDLAVPDMSTDLGQVDVGAPDSGMDLGVDAGPPDVVVMEVEPNPRGTPQVLADGPVEIVGDASPSDEDWFNVVDLPAGSALLVTVLEGDVDWVEFGDFSGAPKRGLVGAVGASRQFFVPATDTYQIGVISAGNSFRYRIRLEVVTDLQPSPLMTGTPTAGLLLDGQVQIWSWMAVGSGNTIAGVDGSGSDIDPFLFVLNRDTGEFLAQDGPGRLEQITFDRDSGNEYWIVVDVYELLSQSAAYQVGIDAQ